MANHGISILGTAKSSGSRRLHEFSLLDDHLVHGLLRGTIKSSIELYLNSEIDVVGNCHFVHYRLWWYGSNHYCWQNYRLTFHFDWSVYVCTSGRNSWNRTRSKGNPFVQGTFGRSLICSCRYKKNNDRNMSTNGWAQPLVWFSVRGDATHRVQTRDQMQPGKPVSNNTRRKDHKRNSPANYRLKTFNIRNVFHRFPARPLSVVDSLTKIELGNYPRVESTWTMINAMCLIVTIIETTFPQKKKMPFGLFVFFVIYWRDASSRMHSNRTTSMMWWSSTRLATPTCWVEYETCRHESIRFKVQSIRWWISAGRFTWTRAVRLNESSEFWWKSIESWFMDRVHIVLSRNKLMETTWVFTAMAHKATLLFHRIVN